MKSMVSGGRETRVFRCRVLFAALTAGSLFLAFNLEFGAEPKQRHRVISVIIRYSGVEPAELERRITEPLEAKLASVVGIDSLRSSTEAGRVRVRAAIRDDTAVDHAYAEIRDVAAALYNRLPEAVQRPRIIRGDSDSFPAAVLSISAPDRSLPELRGLAEEKLRSDLERLQGVAQARVSGGTVEEVHIDIHRDQLAATRLEWRDLFQTLSDRHAARSGGTLFTHSRAIPIFIDARYDRYELLSSVEIRTGSGVMPLGRIASVRAGTRDPETISRINGEQTVLISVSATGDANLLSVSEHIHVLRRRWQTEHGIEVELHADAGGDARTAVTHTLAALAASLSSVLVVVALACRSAARAGEIAIVLTVSLLAATAVFARLGTPLDTAMLAGFAISCGLVVDSTIVLTGSGGRTQVSAVATSVLTTVAALLPFAVVPGIVDGATGLARASTVLAAVSFPVALLVRGCDFFRGSTVPPIAVRRHLSAMSLKHPLLSLTIACCVVIAATVFAFRAGSNPETPANDWTVRVHAEFESGASVQSVDRRTTAISGRLGRLTGVQRIEQIARRDSATVAIEPSGRSVSEQLISAVRRLDAELVDVNLQILAPRQGPAGRTPIELAVTGPDREQTRTLARELAGKLTQARSANGIEHTPLVESVILHFKNDPPALVIAPDRERLATSGLSARSVGETLRWALHGPVILKWHSETGETDVRLRARREQIDDPRSLQLLRMRNRSSSVPMSSVADFRTVSRPARIDRYNRQRASFLTAHYATRSLERTLSAVHTQLDTFEMPPGYAVQVDRRYQRQLRHYRALWILLAGTAIAIPLMVATASESLRIPVATLLFIPPTIALALLPFVMGGTPLEGGVIVGAVIFVGIAVNNAVIIGFQAQGSPIETAINERAPDLILAGVTTLGAAVPLLLFTGGAPMAAMTHLIGLVLAGGTLANLITTFGLFPAIWQLLYDGCPRRRSHVRSVPHSTNDGATTGSS